VRRLLWTSRGKGNPGQTQTTKPKRSLHIITQNNKIQLIFISQHSQQMKGYQTYWAALAACHRSSLSSFCGCRVLRDLMHCQAQVAETHLALATGHHLLYMQACQPPLFCPGPAPLRPPVTPNPLPKLAYSFQHLRMNFPGQRHTLSALFDQ
jgi:hypothetical protein